MKSITVFTIFILVLLTRILANFNLFNYGLSVVLPLVFIPLYFIYNFKNLAKINFRTLPKEYFLFILLVLGVIIPTVLQSVILDNLTDITGRDTFDFMVVIGSLSLSWLCIGSVISDIEKINKSASYLILILLFYILYLLSSSMNNTILVDYYYLSELRADDIVIQHLSLTEPLTYILFLVLALGYTKKIKYVYMLLVTLMFFALGGRTAFFCLLLTLFIYELINSKLINFLLKIFLLFILTIFISFFALVDFESNIFLDKIFFSEGLDSDASYTSRMELFFDFFDGFLEQFVIGNPNFLINKYNNLGSYIHNVLSVFQFYGFFTFAIVIYNIYYISINIINHKIFRSKNSMDIFGVLMFIYAVLALLIGKAVNFGPFWFILGFWLFRLKKITTKNIST